MNLETIYSYIHLLQEYVKTWDWTIQNLYYLFHPSPTTVTCYHFIIQTCYKNHQGEISYHVLWNCSRLSTMLTTSCSPHKVTINESPQASLITLQPHPVVFVSLLSLEVELINMGTWHKPWDFHTFISPQANDYIKDSCMPDPRPNGEKKLQNLSILLILHTTWKENNSFRCH